MLKNLLVCEETRIRLNYSHFLSKICLTVSKNLSIYIRIQKKDFLRAKDCTLPVSLFFIIPNTLP